MISQVTALAAAYGLEDLIAGKIPTLSGWTADPMDAANITDGDIETACFTGNKVMGGGFQYALFEWDLGGFYDILAGGFGIASVTAGTAYVYVYFYDGSNWHRTINVNWGNNPPMLTVLCKASKVRLALTSSAACTLTPNVREFHAWRLQ